ncbi:MAG: ribonuclease E inhibitor RraB [Candidatus Dormiibacterota bacterium]
MSDLLGLFVPRGLLKKRKPPRFSRSEPDPEDLARIEELRIQGSQLKIPHPVRAYLRFDLEKPARDAMEQMGKDGFRCSLRTAGDRHWTLTAVTNLVPAPGPITWLREEMTKLGRELGGTYVGWDAPIVA